jgi:RNA 2',3'-cyclic 3'-phosphodiesterase
LSERIRSFLAFDIDVEEVTRRLASIQKFLVQTGADLKLVEPQNIHMTIRFLDDISPVMVDKVFEEMKRVKFTPFTVVFKGLGAFPDVRSPRVLWVGITQGAEQLKSVSSQIEPGLQKLGFAPDPKGFSPHLTIARVRSGANKVILSDFMTKNGNHEFGSVTASCFRLKKSDLTSNGPIYSTIREFCPLTVTKG